jgi:microcystin-dependent protein
MSQGFPIPLPQRLFDANGVPANNWQIETYVAGLATPLATYSDAGLSSLNLNPIRTDANGYFRMFVAEAVLVKIIVRDEAGVLQFTLDGLEPMPDTGTSPGSVTAVPVGGVIAYSAAAAPTGFLLCDGSLVSRGTYAALFAVVGTTFGAGDGSTTFALPDLRGRFPLGKAASGTGSTLGGSGGAIDHVHTGPSHTHGVTVTRDGWGATKNTPSTTGRLNTGDATGAAEFASSYQPTADLAVTSAAGGTGNTGTANAPFMTLVFIIKT